MTHTTEQVAKIARGLTKAQRHTLLHGSFPAWQRELKSVVVKAALVRKDICTFTHVIAGRGDFHLTGLGAAVRAHLLSDTPHD